MLHRKETQRDISLSKVLHIQHVQPVHHHHGLDQVSPQINVPAYAHRVSPRLNVPLSRPGISTQVPGKNTYTPSNLLLCTVAFHVPKCSSPLFRTSIPTDSSKTMTALFPWVMIHSSGLSFPGALGVKNSLGQKPVSCFRSWFVEDPDEDRDDEGNSQGAWLTIVSRIRSSQSRVACRSRSFHSPWPKMKA